MWLYGSGFLKSMNIGLAIDKKNEVESKIVGIGKSGAKETHRNSLNLVKNPFGGEYEIKKAQNEWEGWGSCLKPAFEPIIVARKPFKGSLVDNVIKYGVGGINIDECRVGNETTKTVRNGNSNINGIYGKDNRKFEKENPTGRFPANLILTYDQMTFDEVCGGFPVTKQNGSIKNSNLKNSLGNSGIYNKYSEKQPLWEAYQDSGSAARYFYCAKASKKDRNEGLEDFNEEKVNDGRQTPIDNPFQRGETLRKNTHPTVKPTELMQYLIRLVTPNNGIILDPFMGSGSTGKAAMYENKERNKNYSFIGIEIDEEYYNIAKARIEGA